MLRAAARAYGNDPAILLRDASIPDDELSYTELERQSATLARGLIAMGAGKGTRIGFIFGNGPQFVLMFAAAARLGAVAVPISTMIRANELVRVLRQSDVHGLIVQREMLGKDYVERLCDALPELASGSSPDLRIAQTPYLRWICSHGEDLPATIRDISAIEQAAVSVDEDLLAAMEQEVHTTDQLVEIYTSGSMAAPKGVRHNHGPAMFRAHYIRDKSGMERGKQANVLLPMFWVGGMMMYMMPALTAGSVLYCTEKTLSNSQMAMGSVLSDDDLKMLAHAPKPWWGLGMSETLGPYSWGDEFRAPGYPVCAPMDHFADGYEVRIVDENAEPVGDGQVGELQIRGYCVTPGLHKMENADFFTADGYYQTGDMCLVEERPQGRRVLFVGRSGDMIKSASSNVSPAEVEMEMQTLEGVHNAYVVGVPDEQRGELVVAAVVPRDGVELDFTEIEAELRKRLSSYKVPRAYLSIKREDVPLLHSNKVARREIAAMMRKHLGIA